MNHIEQEVREMLQSKSRHAPSMEEPPRPVLRRARTRKATNGVALAVIVAILAVGSVAGVRSLTAAQKLAPDAPPARIHGVPWKSLPVQEPNAGPPCRASDVVLVADAGPMSSIGFRGKRANVHCVVERDVALRLVDAVNKPFDVDIRTSGALPGVIVDGSRTVSKMLFEWDNGCAPSTGAIRFVVTLPSKGGTVSAVASNGGKITCQGPRSPTGLELNAATTEAIGNVGSPLELTFRLAEVPRLASTGDTVRYLVLMTNSTQRPIAFDPCPIFSQSISIGTPHQVFGRLNCENAPDLVPPGGMVVFEMKIKIEGTVSGAGEIGWYMWGKNQLNAPVTATIGAR
jgi:hypothetical protein